MIFDFMRTIVFFDLPVQTRRQRRIYTTFRRWLISEGYIMLQLSVYSKIFNNRDAATKHIRKIRANAPAAGAVRVMLVTEKQYARMEIIIGGKTRQEEEITTDPIIVL